MKTSNRISIIVLGRSGSGKGTQAQFILRRLRKQGVDHLETGRFLRQILRKYQNSTTALAKVTMASGRLFPDWFAAYCLLKEIIEKGTAGQHWVFDGAPRSVWQAELIDNLVSWHERPLPVAVLIDVNDKEATKRLLLRSRTDDHGRSIKNRMKFFGQSVVPVINYYKSKKRLLLVNGEQSVEEVEKDINKALKKYFKKNWPLSR